MRSSAQRRTQQLTVARERVPTGDAYQVVVQLWICILTLPELAMLSAAAEAGRDCFAFWLTTKQQHGNDNQHAQ